MKIVYLLPLLAIIVAAIRAAPGPATPVPSNPEPVMILNSETYRYKMLLYSVGKSNLLGDPSPRRLGYVDISSVSG